jgi:hypothetical protein
MPDSWITVEPSRRGGNKRTQASLAWRERAFQVLRGDSNTLCMNLTKILILSRNRLHFGLAVLFFTGLE